MKDETLLNLHHRYCTVNLQTSLSIPAFTDIDLSHLEAMTLSYKLAFLATPLFQSHALAAAIQAPCIETWQPAVDTSWQIILTKKMVVHAQQMAVVPDVDVFDLDLFYTSTETIANLHRPGKKSSGTSAAARTNLTVLIRGTSRRRISVMDSRVGPGSTGSISPVLKFAIS
jgi:hypothetical protein